MNYTHERRLCMEPSSRNVFAFGLTESDRKQPKALTECYKHSTALCLLLSCSLSVSLFLLFSYQYEIGVRFEWTDFTLFLLFLLLLLFLPFLFLVRRFFSYHFLHSLYICFIPTFILTTHSHGVTATIVWFFFVKVAAIIVRLGISCSITIHFTEWNFLH